MNQVQIDRYGLQDGGGDDPLPLHERTLWLQVSETYDETDAGAVDLSAYDHEGSYRFVQGSGLLADLSGESAPGAAWAQGTLRAGIQLVDQALYESELAYREAGASFAIVVASGQSAGRTAPVRSVALASGKKARRRK